MKKQNNTLKIIMRSTNDIIDFNLCLSDRAFHQNLADHGNLVSPQDQGILEVLAYPSVPYTRSDPDLHDLLSLPEDLE